MKHIQDSHNTDEGFGLVNNAVEGRKPTKLIITLYEFDTKAVVATDEDKWAYLLEEKLGILPINEEPSGLRQYAVPLGLLRPFGKRGWPEDDYIGPGSWWGRMIWE